MYSRVVFMHTELSAELAAAGWSKWKQSDAEVPKAFYAEFMPREFLRGADGWNPVAEAARLP
jgi:hypothetical protein